MALRNAGIEHKVVAVAEIDKFAIKSYEAIHGETFNLGDISQIEIEDIPDHDLFTYSFPCQSVSVSGKQDGLAKGSGTTSSLLWECQKVIEAKMPKYLLMENVKNLVSKKFKPFFDEWLEYLESLGYTNYWEVLNGKDFGVPQNRERVFVVSILGEHEPYEFPEPQPLTVRLREVLDEEVDEKFYLKEEQTERLIQNSDYLQDLTSEPKVNILAHRKSYRRNTQVFDPNGITETLDTGQGGGRGHYTIGVKMNRNEVKGEQDVAGTLLARDYKGFGNQFMNGVVIGASRGRNPENPSDRATGLKTEQRLEINQQGTSNTIKTVQKDNYVVENDIESGDELHVKNERGSIEVLRILQGEIGEKTLFEWASRGLRVFREATILQSGLHEEGLDITQSRKKQQCAKQSSERETESGILHKSEGMSGVRINKETGCSSQGRESIQQFARKLDCFMQKLSSEDSQSEEIMQNLRNSTKGSRVLQQALFEIQEIWKPSLHEEQSFRIRKLSPLETWRLMGMSDDDFHKAEAVNSNSQLYKQAGNSIVVNVLEAIFTNLLKVRSKEEVLELSF